MTKLVGDEAIEHALSENYSEQIRNYVVSTSEENIPNYIELMIYIANRHMEDVTLSFAFEVSGVMAKTLTNIKTTPSHTPRYKKGAEIKRTLFSSLRERYSTPSE